MGNGAHGLINNFVLVYLRIPPLLLAPMHTYNLHMLFIFISATANEGQGPVSDHFHVVIVKHTARLIVYDKGKTLFFIFFITIS